MLKRILGLIGWLGVALVLAAVALRMLQPERQQLINYLAIGGLVATLLYLLSQWRDIVRSFSRRNVQYGSLAIGSIALVAAILVAVNWISTRQNKRWDLTSNQQYSLSEQTRKVLADLKEPVQVRVFDESDGFGRFRDVLSEYEYESKNFKVEYVDLIKQPTMAERYQIAQPGTVLFEHAGRTERVTSVDEQQLTNGLIKVLKGRQPKVYFVTGHGERDINNRERDGFAGLAGELRNANFVVEPLALAQMKDVPADADIVVIAGPRVDFIPEEVDSLRRYLKRGGHVMLLVDAPGAKPAPMTNLKAFAREWAVDLGDNVVVDSRGLQSPLIPVSNTYPGHPITNRFDFNTAYLVARSASPVEGGVNGRHAQPVVQSSANSWAETNLAALEQQQLEPNFEGGDLKGPVTIASAIAAAAEEQPQGQAADAPKRETRVFVAGDADFGSNQLLGFQGNRDFALNVFNWLSLQEDLIAIRPKAPDDRRVTLTEAQRRWVQLLSLYIIPGLLFAAGFRVWWRRR